MKLKRYLPSKEQLKEYRLVGMLGEAVFAPSLWHFGRHSVSYAMLVGGVCCFLPIPLQMIPALAICVFIRCNVPITVGIVWISNPLTMPPMMFFAYQVGNALLGRESTVGNINFSLDWFTSQLLSLWQPLLLGSLVCGFTIGITGFLVARIYYRVRIILYLRRKAIRSAKSPKASPALPSKKGTE